MGKKKGSTTGGSKAEKVREYRQQHPEASANEIVEGLRSQGVEITKPHVYNILSQLRSAEGKPAGRRGRRPKSASAPTAVAVAPAAVASSSSGDLSLDVLLEAKKLVDQIGGIEAAKKALDALSLLRA